MRCIRSSLHAIVLLTIAFLFLIGFTHFQYSEHLIRGNKGSLGSLKHLPKSGLDSPESHTVLPNKGGNASLYLKIPPFINAILDPNDSAFQRLECPLANMNRYAYLRAPAESMAQELPKYFFALDLHQCVNLLPRLVGTLVETIRYLGTNNCVLSIVEGRSDDGTYEVLEGLRSKLEGLDIRYSFQTSDIDPTIEGANRIEALAELRNLAVKDLFEYPERYHSDTVVVFSNDVALCSDDVLELIHQIKFQGADQTCAMDWTYVGEHPTFYDVWVARGLTGDAFFNIPETGSWDYAWNLFWNDEKARSRWSSSKPFQVFSCWNGITAFKAIPLMEGKIRFRHSTEEECFQGEPKLFAKDMWLHGHGKIAVIPSINVEYSDEAAKKIKALKGYTSQHTAKEDADTRIDWELTPPEKVKCMPDYSHQSFVAWDEGLQRA